MGKRNSKALIQPIQATEALRRNLLHAMFDSVSTDDVQQLMEDTKTKAKAGVFKEKKLIFDILLASGSAVQSDRSVNVQQAVVVQDGKQDYLTDLRKDVVNLIRREGPLKIEQIAEYTSLPAIHVAKALDSHWFEMEGDGWHITNKARTEVIDAMHAHFYGMPERRSVESLANMSDTE